MSKLIGLCLLVFISCVFVGCRKDNTAPTVSFLSPENNAFIKKDSILQVILEPIDEEGNVSKVELMLDGNLLHVFEEIPWQFPLDLSTLDFGQHLLQAKIYDGKRKVATVVREFTVTDERDAVIGTFAGIRIATSVNTQNNTWYADTSNITIAISKATTYNKVDIEIQPGFNYGPYSFWVENGIIIQPFLGGHPPQITLDNGWYKIYHRPGQAPEWDEYIWDKNQ